MRRREVARWINTWFRGSGAIGIVVADSGLLAETAYVAPDAPRAEFFTGFEASDNNASGYVGGYAFGKGLYEKGLRLRARNIEVTLSGGFTGNYLEDEPSGYVSLGVYRNF